MYYTGAKSRYNFIYHGKTPLGRKSESVSLGWGSKMWP